MDLSDGCGLIGTFLDHGDEAGKRAGIGAAGGRGETERHRDAAVLLVVVAKRLDLNPDHLSGGERGLRRQGLAERVCSIRLVSLGERW